MATIAKGSKILGYVLRNPSDDDNEKTMHVCKFHYDQHDPSDQYDALFGTSIYYVLTPKEIEKASVDYICDLCGEIIQPEEDCPTWNKGKCLTEETKQKISEKLKSKSK